MEGTSYTLIIVAVLGVSLSALFQAALSIDWVEEHALVLVAALKGVHITS